MGTVLLEQLVAGPVDHPRHQLASPVGAVPLLRIAFRDVPVRRQFHIHDVVQVQVQLRESPAGGADVPFVVRPAGLVLVAAHRYVAEEDVAVLPQARHVEEFVGVQRDRGAVRQVREGGAGPLPSDERHDRMVAAGTDNASADQASTGRTFGQRRGLQRVNTHWSGPA